MPLMFSGAIAFHNRSTVVESTAYPVMLEGASLGAGAISTAKQ